MLGRLRKSAFATSLLVLLIYAAWFLVASPFLTQIGGQQPATPDPSGIEHMIAQLPNQIGLAMLLTAVVAILIWWRQVGFSKHERGSLKFIVPPLLLSCGYLVAAAVIGQGFLGTSGVNQLLLVLLVTLLIGFTEELMFRGILFFGAESRFKALWGAIISAVIFGLFHFINLLGGQGFGWTVSQVVHAASDGFMYAALRLITGSMWPVMLLHGLWDLGVSSYDTAVQNQGGALAQALTQVQAGGVSISPSEVLPGLLYGTFVMWRWAVRRKERESARK